MRIKHDRRPFEGVKHKRLRVNLSLRGERRRWLRIALYVLGALIAVVLLAHLFKPEVQLMGTAEVRRITDRGMLVVGVRTDMPGYAEDGEGLEIELARLFAEYLLPDSPDGTAIKYVVVTNRTAQTKLTDGSVDVVLALMQRNASSKFSYSYSYASDACRLLVQPEDTEKPLETMVLGYVQDTASANVLEKYISAHETKVERSLIDKLLGNTPELPPDAITFTKKAFASYPDLIAALANGRIDGAAMTDAYIRRYRGENGLFLDKYGFAIHETELGTAEYAIAASGDETAIAQLADMFIYELNRSGELSALLSKYGVN
ncbi:MAG: transporter substrate-binding domain-containing protein [Christensenellaceae bacterium]|nr:transporter substrate-binding domain-containing protein [Christensenellaceae bacterium]